MLFYKQQFYNQRQAVICFELITMSGIVKIYKRNKHCE